MKNIFKVMGVALLACSMVMVSCKKDDDKESSNIPDGIKVTFNGTTWNGNINNCASYGTALQFSAAETEGDFPVYDEAIKTTEVGTNHATANTTNGGLDNQTYAWVEYYQRTSLVDGNDNHYGDWWGAEVNTEITAIDLTALTVSAKMNGTMFDAAEAFVPDYGQVGVAAATHAPYSATFGNVSLTAK